MKLEVRGEDLAAELSTLARFSDTEPPAVTRVVFSDSDLRARKWLSDRCRDAGLRVREDAVGNTFARWEGSDPSLPAIGTGSHIDAIPHSGRFDGTVGVLGGLEAIRALKRAGFRPQRSIELLIFTSEEPTRFGIGCLGSRLMSGNLDASAGERLTDSQGLTLDAVRSSAGFTGDLKTVRLEPGYYSGFIELHIEQGPLLEQRNIAVGVVTHIAAPASLRVTIDGEGGHAGGVLMPDRHDAFAAAADIALTLEDLARSTGAIDTVATCGVCRIFPGLVNSIPSRVDLELDIRDIDEQRRDEVIRDFETRADAIASRRGVRSTITTINQDSPGTCDPTLVHLLANSCREQGLGYQHMVSRAYHDSLFMTRICPTAMLFIPCRNGVSHRPEEYASPQALQDGTLVLAEALSRAAVIR